MMTAVLLILCILSSGFTGNIYKKISAESKGFSVSAVMLSLTMRLYKRYGTLDLDEISAQLRKEGK